jgi:pyruvate kinase
LPLEDMPLVQKLAIQIAQENAKPIIVATQMLDSMIGNARPTRAHVPRTKRGMLAYAARDIGERLEAKALVASTQSGDTAHGWARLHSPCRC